MGEAIDHLRANGFEIYIVTGGGQEFVCITADVTESRRSR